MENNSIIATGKSIIGDPFEAGIDAAQQALKKLNGATPKFALIFASAGYDQDKLFGGINQIIGNIPSSGCSGEGIITSEGSDEGSSVLGIMLFAGDKLNFANFLSTGLKTNSYKCGIEIAEKFNKYCESSGLLPSKCKYEEGITNKQCGIADVYQGSLMIFPDSMTANITEIFQAFEDTLKFDPLVLGGAAGDMLKFQKTYQYHNGKVYTDAVSAVYISGAFKIDWLVSHGCEEVGLKQVVTKANKNSIVEIDNKPAWEEFKKYLPGNPTDFNAEDAFHLCLGELHHLNGSCKDQLIIRMPVGINKQSGAVKFSVEIPVGTEIHITRRDPQIIADRVISALKELLERNKNKKILAVFQYDCAGRGRVIYGKDFYCVVFEPLRKLVGPDVPWIGFHTYGEIAPICGKVFFHNFTAVIGILFDK